MAQDLTSKISEIKRLVETRQYSKAMHLVDYLLLHHPDEGAVWNVRGYVNAHMGNVEDAINDLTKAIETGRLHPYDFFLRAWYLFEVAQYADAIRDLDKVVELCDFYESDYYRELAYFFRADAYVRIGKYKEAQLDCSHVKDGMKMWTDKLRSKEDILFEALRGQKQK